MITPTECSLDKARMEQVRKVGDQSWITTTWQDVANEVVAFVSTQMDEGRAIRMVQRKLDASECEPALSNGTLHQ